jgi:F0F1-type ATP synthase assembly protein I
MTEDEPQTPAPEQGGDDNRNQWAQVARYIQLGFVLPTATVAGWLLGLALDHWLHTGWIQVVGLILGTAGGIIELLRAVLSAESKDERKP